MHIYILFFGGELISPHKTRKGAEAAARKDAIQHGRSYDEYNIEGWRVRE